MSVRFLSAMAALLALPFLGFMGLGFYWLWEHNWGYQATGITIANSLLIYSITSYRSQKLKAKNTKQSFIFSNPNPNWTDDGKLAAEALQVIKERWHSKPDLLDKPKENAEKLTMEVLRTVAKHFHADPKYPLYGFSLPILLKFITLVCNDLQREVLDRVPGSHAVNVATLCHAKDLMLKGLEINQFYENGMAAYNLPGFVMAKIKSILLGKSIKANVTPVLVQWLLSFYIDKLGYYAIQLYSGQITLDEIEPTSVLTYASKEDKQSFEDNEKSPEPLRLLIIGQVSSGKSSLINALFGEVKSAVSVLPTTSEITPYVLERDGLQQAIILDSAGYGGLTDNILPDDMKTEWTKIDIVLMVCSATNAARNTDMTQLNAIRHYFQEHRKQAMPVVIGVATHIDRLRPLQEWQPPYNVQTPDNKKAQNIRAFCEAMAHDLNLPLENIVPVCLNPDAGVYNIDDGLMPMIHEKLNDAQRVRYLRCLRIQQNKEYWQQLCKQAGVGRLFFG